MAESLTEKSSIYRNEMDLWETPYKCETCCEPMHIRSGQDVMMCWSCLIDKISVERARELLARVRRAAALNAKVEHKDEGFWGIEGMPL